MSLLAVAAGLLLQPLADTAPWPRTGIHDGDNRVVWTSDCCDGDLVVLDFRDENGDGNQGEGTLKLYNASSDTYATYHIGPFYGLWKSFGPFCAPENTQGKHVMTFTSDANPMETTLTITDSFGLVRGMGGMWDFPIYFNTTAPNKFCMGTDEEPLDYELEKGKARKWFAYDLQGIPRAELEAMHEENPYDLGWTVIDA